MNMRVREYCFYVDKVLTGKTIKYHRKKNGFSADELADCLNYTIKNINKWEQGKGLPLPETIIDLCNLFDIAPEELLLPKAKCCNNFSFVVHDPSINQCFVSDYYPASNLYNLPIVIDGENIVIQKEERFFNSTEGYSGFDDVFDRLDYLSQKFVFSWLTENENVEFENYCQNILMPSSFLVKYFNIKTNNPFISYKNYINMYLIDKFGVSYRANIQNFEKEELMFEFYKLVNKNFGKKIDIFNKKYFVGENAVPMLPFFTSNKSLKKYTSAWVKYLNQLEKDVLLTAIQSFGQEAHNDLNRELIRNGALVLKHYVCESNIKMIDYNSFKDIYANILSKVSRLSYEEYTDLRTDRSEL